MEWLNRFVTIMDLISMASIDGIGTSELSKKTLLSKGTLYRILQNMVEHDLIVQDSQTHKYSLGPRSMVWGGTFLAGRDPIRLLWEHCDQLAHRTGLYTYLCRLDAGQVYCVYTKQPSTVRNTYFVHVGQRMPLHCTAAAKAIVAFHPLDSIESLLSQEPLQRYTENTKIDLNDLAVEYHEITRTRVAFCTEEIEVGISAMATPVFHGKDKVVSSIGLIGTRQEIEDNQELLIKELRQIEVKASARMSSAYLLASTGRGV